MSIDFDNASIDAMLTWCVKVALQKAAPIIIDYLKESVSRPGSISPFIVSEPGSPPFDFGGAMVDGFGSIITQEGNTVNLTIYSNVMVPTGELGMDGGLVITNVAQEEEFGGMFVGHRWDGWAYDWMDTQKWYKVGPAHYMAPRPYMGPMLAPAIEICNDLINESGG